MNKREIRKIAESIVRDLNNLENRSKTIQKLAYPYKEKQVEIVLNHLRQLIKQSNGQKECGHRNVIVDGHKGASCTDCDEDLSL